VGGGGEMAQTMYAHMNKWIIIIIIKKKERMHLSHWIKCGLMEIIYKNTKLPVKIIAKCLIAIFKNKYNLLQ
jgi:hypothetical protein